MVFKRSQHRFDTFGRILYINAWSERRKASLIHHPSSSKAYMLPPETTESKAFVEYIFNVIHTGVPTRIAFSPALCCDVLVPPHQPGECYPELRHNSQYYETRTGGTPTTRGQRSFRTMMTVTVRNTKTGLRAPGC